MNRNELERFVLKAKRGIRKLGGIIPEYCPSNESIILKLEEHIEEHKATDDISCAVSVFDVRGQKRTYTTFELGQLVEYINSIKRKNEIVKKADIKTLELLENKVKGYEEWLKRKNTDIDELKEQKEQLSKAARDISKLCDCICFSLIKQFGEDDTLTVDMPKIEDTYGKKVKAEKDEKGKIILSIVDRENSEEGE